MRGGIAAPAGGLFETRLGKPASSAAEALQFWGASSRHYAAKISLHNVFVDGLERRHQVACFVILSEAKSL